MVTISAGKTLVEEFYAILRPNSDMANNILNFTNTHNSLQFCKIQFACLYYLIRKMLLYDRKYVTNHQTTD